MANEAIIRAKMPEGTSEILDNRSLKNDYRTLMPLLRKGLSVLDVGCGTGAISKGIAERIGNEGHVTAIDSSDHLIAKGKIYFSEIDNLELVKADLFNYFPDAKFDLIVSARVLQWLNNPKAALRKLKSLLKPGGQISILDYNHTQLEWKPELPESMKKFYQAFIDWRTDAGMDNEIADHIVGFLKELKFNHIEVIEANEVYKKSDTNFYPKIGIWSKVAETRGKQMVESGYISENFRMQIIQEYNEWIKDKAESMIMHLKETRGNCRDA